MEEDDPDLETAFKVVAIMQTITEDLDESGKRAWRKMLGISSTPESSAKKGAKKKTEHQNSDKK
jgi:hypothetical protein